MRGSRAFSFPRARELRAPQEEQKKSSQRFLREIQDIIDRCERLSLETGCWLQLSAQHLFASGGFLHYTSPRLRKEAKPEVEKITTDLNRLYLKLIAARHQDTRAMQEKLQQAEQSQKLAESSLATVQQAEAEACNRAQLAELRLEAQRKELDILRKQMERNRK
ncbi:unnamed protein product [Mycena citricolor]|uniref:Uncharacterized protein n=1 Tax=Mycena citricolor TaxID=2018698 RepID=A0AAD2HKU2_9AGAR|nr:unnamed protein product [Mycena citricolor]